MKRFRALVLPLLALTLAGCGGGSVDSPSGSGPIGVFVTDAFSDDFDQVWVTIYRVELLGASGTTEVAFDDPAGRIVNVRTLRDAAGGRFVFLTGTQVSASTLHTDVRVTVGPTLTLFARGATTGQSAPVDGFLPRNAQGQPQIRFALANARRLGGGGDDLVIDFDLSRFLLVGGEVVPTLAEGTRTTLADTARQENEDHRGVVSSLAGTAPNRTFTLTLPGGTAFTVQTSISTVFSNASGAPSPALASGGTVAVRGVFDISANRLIAERVQVETPTDPGGEPSLRGVPFAVNAAAGTFTLPAAAARGFIPAQTTITIATGPSTLFRAGNGLIFTGTEFYTRLAQNSQLGVEVEGVYNATAGALLARTARIVDASATREVQASGPATNVNAALGTFTISPLQEYDGFLPAAASVPIVTSAVTSFQDRDGRVIAATTFFAALTSTDVVQADGAPTASGAITARRVRLR